MNWGRWAIIALLVIGSPAYARSKSDIAVIADKARAEALKWQRDAQLVQIEVTQFGFAEGKSGMPDVTKAGPPGLAMFNFFSPSTRQALRVNVSLKLTPEQERFLKSHGSGAMQVERLQTPYSPYTLPIPEKFVDLEEAIAAAQKSGVDRECGPPTPLALNCTLLTGAELHVYWSGAGQTGKPIWKISFHQHPTTLKTVARQIDATSGKVVTVDDLQAATISGEGEGAVRPHSVDLSNIGRDFAAAWKVVNNAVAQQDPLYKPYAVGLLLSLNENHENPRAKVMLHDAYVQFARATPSMRWDDLEVHVEWSSNISARMTIGAPSRRSAPEEPKPTVIIPSKFPDADPTLRKLVNLFPPGYREFYTTTEQYKVMPACSPPGAPGNPPGLKGPYCPPWAGQWGSMEVKHYVHTPVWLSRQDNPYWRSKVAPRQSEYALIKQTAPQEKWVWWTRIMQHGQWQYQIMDAATGALTAECTSPPDENSPNPRPVEQCR